MMKRDCVCLLICPSIYVRLHRHKSTHILWHNSYHVRNSISPSLGWRHASSLWRPRQGITDHPFLIIAFLMFCICDPHHMIGNSLTILPDVVDQQLSYSVDFIADYLGFNESYTIVFSYWFSSILHIFVTQRGSVKKTRRVQFNSSISCTICRSNHRYFGHPIPVASWGWFGTIHPFA